MRPAVHSAICAATLAAVSLPGPAFAQEDPEAQERAFADAVDTMADPAVQEQAALMAAMLVGAVMEMPVGPLAEAAAQMAGEDAPAIDPDARVRDLVGPQAANAPEIVAERLPEMMQAMAGMAGTFEQLLPQMRAIAENYAREMPGSR